MHQVVKAEVDRVAGNIAAPHLDVRLVKIAEKPQINIGGNNTPLRTHPFRKPTHNRTRTGSNLQTTPPRPDAPIPSRYRNVDGSDSASISRSRASSSASFALAAKY